MSESVGSPGAILRRREVERTTTGLRKSQLYELIGRGKFPKPILLGSRSVGSNAKSRIGCPAGFVSRAVRRDRP